MKHLTLLSFLLFLAVSTGRSEKLNVLLITADDLGLQLSCYGDPYIETPHIDALAESGVKFRTAYVTQASCSHFHGTSPFFPRRAITDGRYKLIHNLLAGQAKPGNRVDADPTGKFAENEKYRDTPAGEAFRRYFDPPEWEFYDLKSDPIEFFNLAGNPEHAASVDKLKSALLEWRKETEDPLLEESGFARFEAQEKAAGKRMSSK